MNKKPLREQGQWQSKEPELKKDKESMQDFFSKINLPLYLF